MKLSDLRKQPYTFLVNFENEFYIYTDGNVIKALNKDVVEFSDDTDFYICGEDVVENFCVLFNHLMKELILVNNNNKLRGIILSGLLIDNVPENVVEENIIKSRKRLAEQRKKDLAAKKQRVKKREKFLKSRVRSRNKGE